MQISKNQAISIACTITSVACAFGSGWLWKASSERNAKIAKANEILGRVDTMLTVLKDIPLDAKDTTRITECAKDLKALASAVNDASTNKEAMELIDSVHRKFGEFQYIYGVVMMS